MWISRAAALSAAVYVMVPSAATPIQTVVLFQYMLIEKLRMDVKGASKHPITISINPVHPIGDGDWLRVTSNIAMINTGIARESGYTTVKVPLR